MNHYRSTALERSVKKYWGLKPVLRDPNLALSFYHGSKQVQFAGVFPRGFPVFAPRSDLTRLKISEKIFTGRKTQIKNQIALQQMNKPHIAASTSTILP